MSAATNLKFLVKSGVLLLLVILPPLLVALHRSDTGSTVDRRGPAVVRDLSGGARIQRARIDTFILQTSTMSYDEAAAALNVYSEGYELAQSAKIVHGTPSPAVAMMGVLADRRVAKLYEITAAMLPAQAASTCSALFAEKLQRHVDETMQYRSADPGEREKYFKSGVYIHAVSAAMFLCALFCVRGTVLKQIDDWHAAFPEDRRAAPGVLFSGLPEGLFELNIYFLLGSRHGLAAEELEARLRDLKSECGLEGLELTSLRLYRWSAHTNDTDFTHVHRSIPADDEAILLEIPGFAKWPYDGFTYYPDPQVRALTRARALLATNGSGTR